MSEQTRQVSALLGQSRRDILKGNNRVLVGRSALCGRAAGSGESSSVQRRCNYSGLQRAGFGLRTQLSPQPPVRSPDSPERMSKGSTFPPGSLLMSRVLDHISFRCDFGICLSYTFLLFLLFQSLFVLKVNGSFIEANSAIMNTTIIIKPTSYF